MTGDKIATLLVLGIPFIVLFIAPMIKSKKYNENTVTIFMFAISLVVLWGFRDNGGADDISVYQLYFDRGYSKEPIFNLVTEVTRLIGFNYKGVFLIYSIFTACFMFLALKNCDFEKYDLLLYISGFYFLVFFNMLTIMRQALAAAMLFYLHSCKNVTWKKRFIIWALIVCTHYGFLMLLPIELFIIFFGKKIKTFSKIFIPIIALFVGMFVNLENLIRKLTEFLGLFSYMNTKENYNVVAGLGEVIYIVFGLFLLLVLFDGINKNKSSENPFEEKAQIFQMLYFSFLFITINMRWGNRIAHYFVCFVPLVINYLLEYFNLNGSKRPIKIVSAVGLYMLFAYYSLAYLAENDYRFSLLFR